ncbi:hypothetical protein [Pseudoalteromonas obscura]|uniref:Uncharacterized protein n=1 Tax=Pseudoalteromonas obscura TaxID=3048491 RepID=A0ABT7EK56_9GAMM|nr:hypothetical protein [Pseudoalteromonas sp. P94(2023)]MDK2595401.1 hypothetical protein [Pseudoalteromonas sp. P94(2023)]
MKSVNGEFIQGKANQDSRLKKFGVRAGAGAMALMGSASAWATGDPVKEQINTAVSTGQSNYTLVVVGVIALCAISFGLGLLAKRLSN